MGALLLNKEDLTKATSANDLFDYKVLQCHLIITLSSIQSFRGISETSRGVVILTEFFACMASS